MVGPGKAGCAFRRQGHAFRPRGMEDPAGAEHGGQRADQAGQAAGVQRRLIDVLDIIDMDGAGSNPRPFFFSPQSPRDYKKNKKIGYVVDKGLIIRDNMGKAIRMVGAMTDISDRKLHEAESLELNESLKRYTEKLEKTNEQLEQFAFIASHDLQEPLRMVTNFLEQLQRKYENQLDDKAKKYIYFATDGAKRMRQIILDLLEYSRVGKIDENLEYVDLNEILKTNSGLILEITLDNNKIIYKKMVY